MKLIKQTIPNTYINLKKNHSKNIYLHKKVPQATLSIPTQIK